jgi:hypothetical protein
MPRDDSFAKARNIGALTSPKAFRDSLRRKDKNDFYTFTLNRRSSFRLALSQLKSDLNVSLIREGQVLLKSAKSKTKPEAIATTLAAGTYYVRVYRGRGESRYRLNLAAAPVFPSLATRLLSTGTAQIGAVDPSTGIFSPLANTSTNYTDIAASTSGDLFGTSFSDLFQVDPATGNTSRVGSLNANVTMNSLAFSPENRLYGAGSDGFYAINTSTGAATLIAKIANFNSSGDLIYDPTSQRFLATSNASGTNDILYSIGLGGDAQRIGDTGFRNIWGLTFNNGILYGYTSDRKQITLNPTTGAGTFDKDVTGTTSQIFGAT